VGRGYRDPAWNISPCSAGNVGDAVHPPLRRESPQDPPSTWIDFNDLARLRQRDVTPRGVGRARDAATTSVRAQCNRPHLSAGTVDDQETISIRREDELLIRRDR
jgi:hypothetical protein